MTIENGMAGSFRGSREKFWAALGPALAVVAYTGAAEAATINVNTDGAPVGGKCSITQAIQAARTNVAVGSCTAGSAFSTDTIRLQAGHTYSLYGDELHFSSGGGAVILKTTTTGTTATIMGHDYGFPSSGLNAGVCQYPAAIYAGHSNVTIRDIALRADAGGFSGVCQYSGTLSMTNVAVGDGGAVDYFDRGGLWSAPNTPGNVRTTNLTNVYFMFNFSPVTGAGASFHGVTNVNITNGSFYSNNTNESGGGFTWNGEGSSTLNVNGTDFYYNWASFSFGGAMNLNPFSTSATVVLTNVDIQQNNAEHTGGAIWVGNGFGANKITLSGSFIRDNASWGGTYPTGWTPTERTFNTDPNWAYDTIWCTNGSDISGLNLAPWTSNTPRLRGDGTCVFQNF